MRACAALLLGFSLNLACTALQAADIVIGVPNWPSVSVTANIIKVILEDNYGLQVELQTASNPVIFEAMARGSMQIHPEVWLPNQRNLYEKVAAALVMNRHPAQGTQGMCANRAARDAGIQDIADLSDTAKTRLIDSDGDGRGEIFIGAPGWSSTLVERSKAVAYGYAELLDLNELDEGFADSQLNNAERRGKAWVGYCYAPHHRFIAHPDLALLSQPPYDAAHWRALQPDEDPDWLIHSSVAMQWPPQSVQPIYANALTKSYPMAAALMDNLDISTAEMSDFAYQLVINKRDAQEFARAWVSANQGRVSGWMQ